MGEAEKVLSIKDISKNSLPQSVLDTVIKYGIGSACEVSNLDSQVGQFHLLEEPNSKYYCRESNMSYVKGYLRKGCIDRASYIMFYSAKPMLDIFIRYINKVEELYGMEGAPSELLIEEEIDQERLWDGGGQEQYAVKELHLGIIRVNREWYRSPTLYQLYTLLLRTVCLCANRQLLQSVFNMNKWDGINFLSPFDMDEIDTSGGSRDYAFHMRVAEAVGDMLIGRRSSLFGEDLLEEWRAYEEDTEYGTCEVHELFTYSGPTSFYNAIYSYFLSDSHYRGRVRYARYFKFHTKVDTIEGVVDDYFGGVKNIPVVKRG